MMHDLKATTGHAPFHLVERREVLLPAAFLVTDTVEHRRMNDNNALVRDDQDGAHAPQYALECLECYIE